jgi:hypothetical protein
MPAFDERAPGDFDGDGIGHGMILIVYADASGIASRVDKAIVFWRLCTEPMPVKAA